MISLPALTPRSEHRRHEGGFTLVEMLVSVIVLATVMSALAPAFLSQMTAASDTDYRSVANGLAVAAIEQMRAFPYFEIGWDASDYSAGANSPAAGCVAPGNSYLTAGQQGSAPAWNAEATQSPVELPFSSTTEYNSIFDTPTNNLPSTETLGPITYTVYRCVYWMNSSTNQSDAYKLVWIGVAWTVSNSSWHVSQTSALYPGGEGPYSAPMDDDAPSTQTCGDTGSAPATPIGLTAAVDGTNPTGTIDLTWTEGLNPPAEGPVTYRVSYSTSPVGPWTPYSDNSLLTEIVDGLTPTNAYYFEVVAVACDGTQSVGVATAMASTTSGPQSCTYSNFTVSPPVASIGSNDKLNLITAFQVSVQASNACGIVAVSYSPQNNATIVTDQAPSTSGLLTWSTSATKWTAGSITFNLVVAGSTVGSPQQVQITCSAKQC